jgi:hypothetical protein
VLGNEPRHASGLRTSDPGQPLETYHPETTHLTATRSCEDCSAFTRVAARTLAPSPIRDQLHRGLQPFCYLHDCSGCFRLERLPGGACTHWKAPPCHGAHVKRSQNSKSAHPAGISRERACRGAKSLHQIQGVGRRSQPTRRRILSSDATDGFRQDRI